RAHDLRDHRQPADHAGGGVADADGQQVAVEVGLAPVGVEGVDRPGAGDRLDAADQGEGDRPLHRGPGRDLREVGHRDGGEQAVEAAYQQVGAEAILDVGEQIGVHVVEVEVDP